MQIHTDKDVLILCSAVATTMPQLPLRQKS